MTHPGRNSTPAWASRQLGRVTYAPQSRGLTSLCPSDFRLFAEPRLKDERILRLRVSDADAKFSRKQLIDHMADHFARHPSASMGVPPTS